MFEYTRAVFNGHRQILLVVEIEHVACEIHGRKYPVLHVGAPQFERHHYKTAAGK
jgi:hypothetical protein